jgi:hypothetical protein
LLLLRPLPLCATKLGAPLFAPSEPPELHVCVGCSCLCVCVFSIL